MIVLVGALKGARRKLARKCSWCGSWFSENDREMHAAGAQITHGCCRDCMSQHFPPEAA